MPTVRAGIDGPNYKKWLAVKADLSDGRKISNAAVLIKLINHYNREKGRKLI